MKYVVKVELWEVDYDHCVWFEQSPEMTATAPVKEWKRVTLHLWFELWKIIRARLT